MHGQSHSMLSHDHPKVGSGIEHCKDTTFFFQSFIFEEKIGILKYFFTVVFQVYFNLKLLRTTLMLDRAMRAEAHMGVIWKSMPKRRRTPAAKGMQTML